MKFTKTTVTTKTEKIDFEKMSDEEFEELINCKKLEVEELSKKVNININNIRSMIDENYLSDETIKHLICNRDEPAFIAIIVSLFLILFLSPIALPFGDYLSSNKLLMTIYGLLVFGLMVFLFVVRERKKEVFSNEVYKNAQLFKSDFVKVKTALNTNKHDKNLLDHYVVFLDENNKKRKSKISKELYNKYKISPPNMLYVVKIPKYKHGKFYHAFYINETENVSSIKETNKNYIS